MSKPFSTSSGHAVNHPKRIHIALCHYQFEVIHPFLDGNGRVGRLLIMLLLIEQKMLPSPLLYLSAFFEATRDEYYKQLYRLSSKGIWNEWFIYFLNGVAVQSEDVLSRAERINELLNNLAARYIFVYLAAIFCYNRDIQYFEEKTPLLYRNAKLCDELNLCF